MAVVDRVSPYAERLLEDRAVQQSLRDAIGSGRDAYGRARSKRKPKKAIRDPKVQKRVREAVLSARDAVSAMNEPPPKPKSRWLKRLLGLAVIGGGVLLAVSPDARAQVMQLVGGGDQASPSQPTTN